MAEMPPWCTTPAEISWGGQRSSSSWRFRRDRRWSSLSGTWSWRWGHWWTIGNRSTLTLYWYPTVFLTYIQLFNCKAFDTVNKYVVLYVLLYQVVVWGICSCYNSGLSVTYSAWGGPQSDPEAPGSGAQCTDSTGESPQQPPPQAEGDRGGEQKKHQQKQWGNCLKSGTLYCVATVIPC